MKWNFDFKIKIFKVKSNILFPHCLMFNSAKLTKSFTWIKVLVSFGGGALQSCLMEKKAVLRKLIYHVFYDCFEQCRWRITGIKDSYCVWLWEPQRWFISQGLKEMHSLTIWVVSQTMGEPFELCMLQCCSVALVGQHILHQWKTEVFHLY